VTCKYHDTITVTRPGKSTTGSTIQIKFWCHGSLSNKSPTWVRLVSTF